MTNGCGTHERASYKRFRLHAGAITSDGNKCYLSAVEDASGAGIDYAMLQKV